MNIKKSIACAIVSIENNAPSTLGKVFYILAILVDITFYYAAAAVLVTYSTGVCWCISSHCQRKYQIQPA